MTNNRSSSPASGFPIGVAVKFGELRPGSDYKRIVTEHFGSVTAENIFKAPSLHPQQDQFQWEEADQLAGYCAYHQKRLHGHTLIWHREIPQWLHDLKTTRSEWEQIFKTHIQTIVKHFAGKVAGWDVINEAFNNAGKLRESFWKKKLGTDYPERAFSYAREADAHVQLFYNDFDLECNPVKRTAVLNYLDLLREKGTPIDGIGLQMHVNIMRPEISQIREALQEISGRGYTIHLSELDISVNVPEQRSMQVNELLSKQAEVLQQIVSAYQAVPATQQYGITFWGVSDQHSWLNEKENKDRPLLFDEQYRAKPAFGALKKIVTDKNL